MQLDDRVILVDKGPGYTSFAAVRTLRRLGRLQKVGHCGSLDPLATGLLVLCTGVATRVASLFVDRSKVYQARVRFGRATDSYDADGRTTQEAPVPGFDPEMAQAALRSFVGEIDQRPPMVSAVKVQGKRLYELARAGTTVERPTRKVRVYEIGVVELASEYADIRVHCGRGCYVRSIAHEWGERLGIPAHLESLRRLAIGDFGVERAATLQQFEAAQGGGDEAAVAAAVWTLPRALGFLPALYVRRAYESAVGHGVQPVPQALRAMPPQPGAYRLLSEDGCRLVGILEVAGQGAIGAMRLMLIFPAPLAVDSEESKAF